jgi:hypothetical protein
VLGVVQEEKRPSSRQAPAEDLAQLAARLLLDLEHLRQSRDQQVCVAEGCQWHPPQAVGIRLGGFGHRLEREPALPRTLGPPQREKTEIVALQELDDLGQLALPPEERGRRSWEVRLTQAQERREDSIAELEDALWRSEILEAVLAKIDEGVAPEQRRCRRGHEDLPTVARRRDPRSPVDVTAHVALGGHDGRSGVQSRPHTDRPSVERIGRVPCGGERPGRGRECEEKGIALRVHLNASVAGARISHDPPVLR